MNTLNCTHQTTAPLPGDSEVWAERPEICSACGALLAHDTIHHTTSLISRPDDGLLYIAAISLRAMPLTPMIC